MKTFGIVSYNIYCNFTNYGSALQSWALSQAVNRLGGNKYRSMLVDYCPQVLKDKDPLNPFKNMWDKDEQSRRLCEMTLPAIRENYKKFDRFYRECFLRTRGSYTAENFEMLPQAEGVDGFICGSDTIFCIEEFGGFDDGYFANYPCMRRLPSVAYAASFGDANFDETTYAVLNERLQNFRAIGLREDRMVPYVQAHTQVPVSQVWDPTLILPAEAYAPITGERQVEGDYLLLYTRRYNEDMERYAEMLAQKNGWKIVEISLRATNAEKGHIMRYDAGVEEFLSLVKHAKYVVTNSFHGIIFSTQFKTPFTAFSREQCGNKIDELLTRMGVSSRRITRYQEQEMPPIDFDAVHARIAQWRNASLAFLEKELDLCL